MLTLLALVILSQDCGTRAGEHCRDVRLGGRSGSGCHLAPANSLASPNSFTTQPPWVLNGNGAAAPSTTGGQTGPDGTASATRIDYAAASGTAYSYIENQSALTANAVNSCSVWVNGVSSGGTEDFCLYDGAAWQCVDCTYVTGAWGICRIENVSVTSGTLAWGFGGLPNQHSGEARAAQQIYTWGGECNVGIYAVPYGSVCDTGPTAVDVALDGHSILEGLTSAAKPPAISQSVDGRATPSTWAIGGSTAAACASRTTAILQTNATVFGWMCAVNDILNAGIGVNIWRGTAQAPNDTMVAAGKLVVVMDELPCNGPCGDGGSEELQNYNLMAHAWCDIHPSTATCLRDYALFGAVADPTYMNSAYSFPDGLHMNDAGSVLLGTSIGNVIVDAGLYECTSADNLFAFATNGGSNLGTPCDGGAIVSADGGTITVTRTGTAYCNTKGNAWTGLATGDIQLVRANQPRVEPGADGGLGVLREKAGTNNTTFPADLNGADWASQGVVVASPVVTAGQVDPLGGTAGVRLDLAAVDGSGLQGSLRYNLTGCAIGAGQTMSLFVRGVAGVSDTGTIDVCEYDSPVPNHCFDCAFVSGSWSRCYMENFTTSTPATGYYILGNAAYYDPTPTARGAQSVIVYGAQCETSPVLTSFMGASRGGETMTATVSSSAQTQSIVATIDAPSTLVAGATAFQFYKDANNDVKGYETPSTLTCDYRKAGTSHTVVSTASNMSVSAPNRVACWFDEAVQGAKVNSVADYFDLVLRTNTISTGSQEFNIGGRHASGSEPNAIVRDVSVWSKAGCR